MSKTRSLLLFLVACSIILSGCDIVYNNNNINQEIDYEKMYNDLAKEYDTLKMDRDRKVKEFKKLKRKYQDLLDETDTSDMQAYVLDKDFNVVWFNVKSNIKSSIKNYVEYFDYSSHNDYSTIYICSKKEIKEITLINSNGEQEKVKKRKIEKETYVIDIQPEIFEISTIMIKMKDNKNKYYFSFCEM